MALKQQKTTRWIARVGVAVVSFVLEILKSFLNFKKEDGLLTKGKKTANLIVRTSYRPSDFLKKYQVSLVK